MDISRVDLNLLKLLFHILEEKSVSAAARRLNITQSTASGALARLRDVFGDELFIRTSRGMRATPLAASLEAPLRAVMKAISDDILRRAGFDPLTSTHQVTMVMSDIGELIFLPRMLRLFREQAPNMTLRSVVIDAGRIEAALEAGSIDLVLGSFPNLTSPNIMSENLYRHAFACLARADHPTISGSLTLEQFLAADHLVFDARSQDGFEATIRERRYERRILLRVPHLLNVPELLAASDMICTVPAALGVRAGPAPLQMMKPPFPIPDTQIRQIWHRGMNTDALSIWLRTLIADNFRIGSA